MNNIDGLTFPAKVTETAGFLRVSEPTLRMLIRTNQLHAIRVGRGLRITRESLETFLKNGCAA